LVSIPSPVGNYLMLWFISLGSSMALMGVAAVIYMITGKTEGLTEIFILMFNGSATIFILLTMIPAGLFILIFAIVWNAGAPIVAPMLGALWNFFAGLIIGLANLALGLLNVNIPFRPLTFVSEMPNLAIQLINSKTIYLVIADIEVTEAIAAVTSLLAALKDFLIETATGGNSGSGVFEAIIHQKGIWS